MKFLGRMKSQSKRLLTSVAISQRNYSELHRCWLATTILPHSFSTFPTTTHGWLKKSAKEIKVQIMIKWIVL